MPDILIRGMEMPQNCLECTLCAFDGCGSDYCPFTGIEALSIGRQVNCPLIELPPHGDLIDRSELLEKSKVHGMYPHWIDTMDVKRAPVVVTAERRDADA